MKSKRLQNRLPKVNHKSDGDPEQPGVDTALDGSEQAAILDDAKREMFGDDADLLSDDMGAK